MAPDRHELIVVVGRGHGIAFLGEDLVIHGNAGIDILATSVSEAIDVAMDKG